MFPKTTCFLGLAAFLLGVAASPAQTPVGAELRVNEQGKYSQFDQVIGVNEDGDFLIAWQSATPDGKTRVLAAQWFSPTGQKIGHNQTLNTLLQYFQPALGPGLKGGVSVYWRETRNSYEGWDVLFSRDFSPDNTWQSPERKLTFLRVLAPRFVRSLPEGGHVVALRGMRPHHIESRSFLLFTDAEGRVVRGPSVIYPTRRGGQYVGGLAVSPFGEVLVTWTEEGPGSGGGSDVLAQLFSPQGRPLRSPVRVHANNANRQFVGRVAALEDRGYVVVWDEEDYKTGAVDLRMRFLNPDGTVRGPILPVSEREGYRFLGGDIAADAAGNFFVVWDDGDVWGRLFRPDGTPVGPDMRLNRYTDSPQEFPIVATGANGTFIVAWQSFGQDGDAEGIFGQVVAASPADEVCGLSSGRIRCDLARSGGEAELKRRLRPGEWVTGDWDGNGREDLCRFSEGSWLCDLDHFGAPYEASFTFGQAGDRPLLGDIDGDRRTDACVRRGDQLLCDTARDGGAAEAVFAVGEAADALSLADVDGDGRAEACVVRGASFLCDTGHDGGAFEWERIFGSGTDIGLFGDSNGDGRHEPCLYRGGELLCDAAQDGGEAEMRLPFPLEAGERLVMVNLDGL